MPEACIVSSIYLTVCKKLFFVTCSAWKLSEKNFLNESRKKRYFDILISALSFFYIFLLYHNVFTYY